VSNHSPEKKTSGAKNATKPEILEGVLEHDALGPKEAAAAKPLTSSSEQMNPHTTTLMIYGKARELATMAQAALEKDSAMDGSAASLKLTELDALIAKLS